jgi:hypothetical protein
VLEQKDSAIAALKAQKAALDARVAALERMMGQMAKQEK